MALPLVPVILSALAPVIDRLVSNIPDPEAQHKERVEIESLIAGSAETFRSFVVEYEGAGKDVHWTMQILRSSVRPILTYALAGSFIYGFLNPTAIPDAQMEMLWQLNLLSMGFWYGERALSNLGLDLRKVLSSRKEKSDLEKWRESRG